MMVFKPHLQASSGKLKLVIDKFNIQWSSTCKTKDYLFVGQISSYTKVWLCGSSVPNDFSALVSKKKAMTVRFVSNGSGRKSGFKVRVIATSWSEYELPSLSLQITGWQSTDFKTKIDDLTDIQFIVGQKETGRVAFVIGNYIAKEFWKAPKRFKLKKT